MGIAKSKGSIGFEFHKHPPFSSVRFLKSATSPFSGGQVNSSFSYYKPPMCFLWYPRSMTIILKQTELETSLNVSKNDADFLFLRFYEWTA